MSCFNFGVMCVVRVAVLECVFLYVCNICCLCFVDGACVFVLHVQLAGCYVLCVCCGLCMRVEFFACLFVLFLCCVFV